MVIVLHHNCWGHMEVKEVICESMSLFYIMIMRVKVTVLHYECQGQVGI